MSELFFIGPRQGTLAALRVFAGGAAPDWSVRHCTDPHTAVDRLQQRPANVVLAGCIDVGSCERLFAQVADRNPAAIRLALFENPPISVKGAHQTVAVRDDPADLFPVLSAAAGVSVKTAADPHLRRIVAAFQDVPSPPTLYFDIREQIDGATGSTDRMAQIASRDPSLVARTLRIANSGLYARPGTIGDLREAIGLLGTDTLLGLVLAAHLYAGLPPPGLRLDALWTHASIVSALAQRIARIEGGTADEISASVLAGLLHDIGLLVLLQNEAARYRPLLEASQGRESHLTQMEHDTFGITHADLGAIILMLWTLPVPVVAAVANSHASAGRSRTSPASLSVVDRAVMAAEWLLDDAQACNEAPLPALLNDTPAASLPRWLEARDELVGRPALQA